MKNTKKILATTVAVISLLSATTGYALETKIINAETEAGDIPQISISNVIGVDDYLTRPDDFMEGYTCLAPVTVSLLADEMDMFEGIQIVPVNNTLYYASYQPPVTGSVREHENNTVIPYNAELEALTFSYLKDCSMNITKPGMYHVMALSDDSALGAVVCLNVVADVAPTESKIYVDGKEVQIEGYNIDDNNHFKLRDIAKAVSGSEKQFEVTWDAERSAVDLISNTPYTEVGGELVLGDGTVKRALPSTANMYVNGKPVGFTAYNIKDNNYFELRDIGQLFNFDVTWDAETNSILIETDKDYSED